MQTRLFGRTDWRSVLRGVAAFGFVLALPAWCFSGPHEWKLLFDGKSLDGWKAAAYHGSGKVGVRHEAIVMERGKAMTGVVYTRHFPKGDYEVTLEGKRLAGHDFFCTTTFPIGNAYCSFVVSGWGGSIVGLSSINNLDASQNETSRTREFEQYRWYRIRIRVSPKRIEAWIDNSKLVDLDTTDRLISTRMECNACKPFGIATYDTTGAVRAIRIRRLTKADLKAIAATPQRTED